MNTEFARILIQPPVNPTLYPEWQVPVANLPVTGRVQITAYHDEMGHVLERWLLSETDERWYRVERYTMQRVSVPVKRKVAVAQ